MRVEGSVCHEAMDAFPRYLGAHVEPLGRHPCSFADTGRVGTQLAVDDKGSERRGSGQGRTGKRVHHRSVLLKNPLLLFIIITFFGHALWHVGSQFPDQGSNAAPSAVEAQSLNCWTTMEFIRCAL